MVPLSEIDAYSHTAATAAGNYQIPVIANGFNYGYASGMAPGARQMRVLAIIIFPCSVYLI